MILDFRVSLWPAHHRLHKSGFQDEDVAALGKTLSLLDGILDGQVRLPGVLLKTVWWHVQGTDVTLGRVQETLFGKESVQLKV